MRYQRGNEIASSTGIPRHQRINWDIELGALWQRLRGIACRMDLLGTLSKDGSPSAAPGEPSASGV